MPANSLQIELGRLIDQVRTMDDRVDAQIARLRTAESRLKARMPVAPNLIADTKKFATLCGGQANTEMELIAGHAGSSFSAIRHGGTTARGTIEVVTPANFGGKGLDFEGDLEKAINPRHLADGGARAGFIAAGGKRLNVATSGIDFNAVLIDITISSDQTNGTTGNVAVLAQGRQKYLTRDSGGFRTQAHCLVNVLAHSDDIALRPFFDYGHLPEATAAHLGRGWTWLRTTETGFDKPWKPNFHGQGRMKVALALPYWSTGDHGDAYVWAGSTGRYTHGDYLPTGRTY